MKIDKQILEYINKKLDRIEELRESDEDEEYFSDEINELENQIALLVWVLK